MLVTVETLVAGLAVVTVAFEAPMAASALGAAAFRLFRIPFEGLGAVRVARDCGIRRASALRMQHLI